MYNDGITILCLTKLFSSVVLQGGSNGFEWKAMQLPAGVMNLGIRPVSGEHNRFEKNPEVGDVISGKSVVHTLSLVPYAINNFAICRQTISRCKMETS